MKEILVKMLEIYQPDGIDWMGYSVSRNNPYTFHHIKEVRQGGKLVITNGAILTRHAHEDLNRLDILSPYNYNRLNRLFKELNETKSPPTPEYYEEVDNVLVKCKTLLRYYPHRR